MIIVNNNIEDNQVSIYGAYEANRMVLIRVQDSKEIDMPILDVSISNRFGTFILSYDSEIELNTAILDNGKTKYNLIPGKYNFSIGNIKGILNIQSEKEQNKVYEQENTSKIYHE